MDTQRLNTVVQHYEDWWNHRNADPVLYIIHPTRPMDYAPVARDWMAAIITARWSHWQQEFVFGQAVLKVHETGDWTYMDEALDLLDYYVPFTGHSADGFPFLFPTLGASMMEALVCGHAEFLDTTIWLEMPEPMDWDALLALDATARHPLCDVLMEGLRRACERVQQHYVFARPELGGMLDVLATMRGTGNLLLDLIDRPEDVEAALATLEDLWWGFTAEFQSIIGPGNHGCDTIAMRVLSGRPMECGTCDFSAMISPAMFERFVMPSLQRQCDRFEGRIVWHLDGPGEIPHLQHLLAMDGVHAIQWVPGAGNAHGMDPRHDDLYRRILDAGKKIVASGPARPELVADFFRRFPREAFVMNFAVSGPEQSQELLKAAGM